MNISEELIKEIVAKVCENLDTENKMPFERKMLSNGMFCVKTDTVKCEAFPFDIGDAQAGTSLLDVATLEETPRISIGVMEMDHCEFPWTLNYDEAEYVIEGNLTLKTAVGNLESHAGDINYIPKGSPIRFSTPDHCRFMYVCYPADWFNQ